MVELVGEGAGRARSSSQVPSLHGGRILRPSSTFEVLSDGGLLVDRLLLLR